MKKLFVFFTEQYLTKSVCMLQAATSLQQIVMTMPAVTRGTARFARPQNGDPYSLRN
jgi:hypothetical protein